MSTGRRALALAVVAVAVVTAVTAAPSAAAATKSPAPTRRAGKSGSPFDRSTPKPAAKAAAAKPAAPAPPEPVSFDLFIRELSPHGAWGVSEMYGRVWQPFDAGTGWHPYQDGHWVETDLGHTWVSNESWGALTHHYGTWALDPFIGWCWVPGYTWAPAWVAFRTGAGTIGWAPVPVRYRVGMDLGPDDCSESTFVFVPERSFLQLSLRGTYLTRSRTKAVFPKTKLVNQSLRFEGDFVVNRALGPRQFQRAGGHRVRPVPIEKCPRLGKQLSREQIAASPMQRLDGLRATQPVRAMRGTHPQERLAAMRQAKAARAAPAERPRSLFARLFRKTSASTD